MIASVILTRFKSLRSTNRLNLVESHTAMGNINTGKEYEKMVMTVYSTLFNDEVFSEVRHNVMLPGPDGTRQIDVLDSSRARQHQVFDYN